MDRPNNMPTNSNLIGGQNEKPLNQYTRPLCFGKNISKYGLNISLVIS